MRTSQFGDRHRMSIGTNILTGQVPLATRCRSETGPE
jgi:hypothetical protein